jgi:hypothetical protein
VKWLQWTPDRTGIIGGAVAVLVVVGLFAFGVIYLPNIHQQRAGAGFGPDWECTAHAEGGPTCIKKFGR